MESIRKKIDRVFYNWGALVIRFKWLFFIAIVAMTGFMLAQFPNLKMDTSNEGFFKENDLALINYNKFRDQFGRDEMIVLMIHSDNIFSQAFLKKLAALHEEIEETVPNVNDVSSLINIRQTVGEDDTLNVDDFLEEIPESEKKLQEKKEYALQHPLYKNLIISEDGRYTVILVETDAYSSLDAEGNPIKMEDANFGEQTERELLPLTDQENSAIIHKIDQIKEKYDASDFKISFTGTPVVIDYLKRAMQEDMRKFTALAVLGILIFLFLTFRRIPGMVLPLLTVILSLIFTLGMMSLTGTRIKIPTQILPSFLLAVGIGAAVHLMAIFYKDYHKEKGNKNQAIKDALEHSGLPIFMTSITTAAGLLSFSTAEVAPIGDLGKFSAFGILVSLFMTLTLIPSLLAIIPAQSQKHHETDDKKTASDHMLLGLGYFAADHAKLVVGISIALMIAAFIGISRLNVAHNVLAWFPEDSVIRQQTNSMDQHLKGTVSIELMIDTKKENGLYLPDMMNALDELEHYASQLKKDGELFIGKALTLSTMLKEIHQALNGNSPDYYKIPQNKELIAQEFLLFENSGSDDLENNVDSQFSVARFTAKTPWTDAVAYKPILDSIEDKAKELFTGKADVMVTGMITLFSKTIDIMISTTITSYLIAGIVITFMMVLLIGSLKIGLISMIPNLSPIVLTLGMMGFFGIPLDMFTLLIGSIAIGIAVDDTIHFFHNYRKYYAVTGSSRLSIEHTLSTAGRAMLVTTIVLTLGFWIFMLAGMNNLFNFGLLTGITLLLAFLADVLLAPALLTLVNPDKN